MYCGALTLKWDFRTKAHRMLDLVLWLARNVKKSTNQVMMMMTKLLRKRAEMVLKWGICYKNVRSSQKKKESWSQKTLFPNNWNGNLSKNSTVWINWKLYFPLVFTFIAYFTQSHPYFPNVLTIFTLLHVNSNLIANLLLHLSHWKWGEINTLAILFIGTKVSTAKLGSLFYWP